MRIRVGSGMALLMLLAAASAAHGQRAADEMEGVLHLTVDEAWISGGGGRIRLIQVPPQTAVDVEPLLARTAATLVDLAEKRVRVTGYLESNILWNAVVEELEEEEQVVEVVEVEEEEGKNAGDCPPVETSGEEGPREP